MDGGPAKHKLGLLIEVIGILHGDISCCIARIGKLSTKGLLSGTYGAW